METREEVKSRRDRRVMVAAPGLEERVETWHRVGLREESGLLWETADTVAEIRGRWEEKEDWVGAIVVLNNLRGEGVEETGQRVEWVASLTGWMQRRRPEAAVLAVSGYWDAGTEEVVPRTGVRGFHFLPCPVEEMARWVRTWKATGAAQL